MVIQRRIREKKKLGWIILAIFLFFVIGMFAAMLIYSVLCLTIFS